jgi:hypothetical protein
MAVPKWGGWWVKATVNSAPSAWGRPPRGVCSSSKHNSDQIASWKPTRTSPWSLRPIPTKRKKFREPILGSAHKDSRGRIGRPRPINTQPAASLTGFARRLQHPNSKPRQWWRSRLPSGDGADFRWSRILPSYAIPVPFPRKFFLTKPNFQNNSRATEHL